MPNEGSNSQINSQSSSSKRTLVIFVGLLLIVAVLAAMWFIVKYPTSKPTETTTTTTTKTQAAPVIKSDIDLKKLEDEVRNVNIDSLGEDLNLNDKDASEF